MTKASGGWEWDETLYAGAARYYPAGRMPYPDGLARAIGNELALDGTGRLLDVGCGPGSLTLLLAAGRWPRPRRARTRRGVRHRVRDDARWNRRHRRAALAEAAQGGD